MSFWEPLISNALGSAGAGVFSRLLTHPLDTVKARLQVDGMQYKGPLDALWKTYSMEGMGGLYRGFSTVIVGGTPGTILYLCSYDIFKVKIAQTNLFSSGSNTKEDREGHFGVHFASGLLAEAVACLIYVPVDVIKERLQVQHAGGHQNYEGGADALRKIWSAEGVGGIYKGYGATMMSFGPFSALYFLFYEKFKAALKHENSWVEIPTTWLVVSSSAAGAIASFLTSPLDLAKLRLQVQRGNIRSSVDGISYRGMIDCLQQTFRRGGVQELFRGAGARILHFVPATTFTMTTYETLRRWFHDALWE